MTAPRGLITVWLDVRPEHEAELNDWYALEHIPQVVGLEGFVVGRRYHCADAPLRYLAWYETVDERVEPGPHFQALVANPTPWSVRIRRLYGERRERRDYRLVAAHGGAGGEDAPWLELVELDAPAAVAAQSTARLGGEILPRLAATPGVSGVRHYECVAPASADLIAIELDAPDVLARSPAIEAIAVLDRWRPRRRRCRLILTSVHHGEPRSS